MYIYMWSLFQTGDFNLVGHTDENTTYVCEN